MPAPICKSMARAIVAEDSAILLGEMETLLTRLGIDVIGVAASLSSLRELAESQSPDVAVLNVNLNGELVFPVADLLISRGVPIIFVTGYVPESILPPHLRHLPTLRKPVGADEMLRLVDIALIQAKARQHRGADSETRRQA